MKLISDQIAGGAKWFVRSDIKDFFTRVPKDEIRIFLVDNVPDPAFVELFMAGLGTELENEAEVREQLHLFPIGDLGVPQGSALSALCANVILADFDSTLNGRGISTVRYLDDFLILGRTKRSVERAWDRARQILQSLGMEAHDPANGTGKASSGQIEDGFDFLSFRITDGEMCPSKEVRREFLRELRKVL